MDNSEIEKLILELYNNKYSINDIKIKLNLTQYKVYSCLKQHNVLRNRSDSSKNKINIKKDDLYKLYIDEKKNLTEIASIYNTYHTVISSKLKKFNIPMRAKGEAKIKYHFSKEILYDLYINQKKSIKQIKEELAVNNSSQIRDLLKKYNIPIRNTSEACKIYYFNKEELYDLYFNKKLSLLDISNKINISSETIRKNLIDFGIPASVESGIERMTIKRYKNGSCPTSKQQLHIHSLVGGELNYPVGRNNLDIAFPEEKIYIEYDGSGHDLAVKIGKVTKEKFNEKQRRRNYYMYRRGWKVIRLISPKDFLPDDDNIKYLIRDAKEKLNKTDLKYIDILLDKNGE